MQARERVTSPTHRLPAPALEAVVIDALRAELEEGDEQFSESRAGTAAAIETATNPFDGSRQRHTPTLTPRGDISLTEQARALIDVHLIRVVVWPNRLDIDHRGKADDPAATTTLSVPWVKPAARVRRALVEPDWSDAPNRRMAADERNRLTLSIASARAWLDGLVKGTISDLAEVASRHDRSERSIRQTLSLAFLDSALIDAACAGTLPRGYGVSRLMELPSRFADQWRALGLQRSV